MKSGNIVQLTQRAIQIRDIVLGLRSEISHLKSTILKESYNKERKLLASENEKLKQELDLWMNKLVQVEKHNGVPQIPLSGTHVQNPVLENKEPVLAHSEVKVEDQAPEAKKLKQKKSDQDKPEKTKPEKLSALSDDNKPVDVSRLDLRIGKIVFVEKHKDADSLYVEKVNLGEGETPRTVVSGLVKHVPIEEMQDRLVVLLCNLKPAKMRGITSEAMVMCASTPEKVEILTPPEGSLPGDRVTCEGYPGEPDVLLNPKKKIFEQVAPDLKTDPNCLATYKGVPFTVLGLGQVKAATLKNAPIK